MRPVEDDPQTAIDSLSAEFFRCVSFSAGERPNYAGIRTLFVPLGILFKGGAGGVEATTVEEFIEPRQRSVDEGTLTEFRETELSATTSIFGHAAHRQSYYDKAGTTGGVPFTGRGIIFTQFVFLNGSWLMSSMAWDDERDGLALGEPASPETNGVSVELLSTVDLGHELPGLDGRQLRMRMVTIEPQGTFGPVHDHKGRPGIVYVLRGAVTDHRDGIATEYGPGAGWPEDRNTLHWLENRGTVPAVEISVDIVVAD